MQKKYVKQHVSNRQTSKVVILLVTTVLSGWLSACGTLSEVKDSDRDTTGKYDGRWIGTLQKTPSKQLLPGNWTFNCSNREGATIGFSVADGVVASGFASDKLNKANINKAGNFRLEVPSGYSASASGTSDLSINSGDITWIIQGRLGKKVPSGYFVGGVAEFGNQGCTTKVLYKRVSS